MDRAEQSLLSLRHPILDGGVGSEAAAGEALNGPVCLTPVSLPVGPCFLCFSTAILGGCGYHGSFRDGYPCVVDGILAIFFLADQTERGREGLMPVWKASMFSSMSD